MIPDPHTQKLEPIYTPQIVSYEIAVEKSWFHLPSYTDSKVGTILVLARKKYRLKLIKMVRPRILCKDTNVKGEVKKMILFDFTIYLTKGKLTKSKKKKV